MSEVKILGIAFDASPAFTSGVTHEDSGLTVEVFVSTPPKGLSLPRKYAAMASVAEGDASWSIEGPYAGTPQAAADALHTLIRKLAAMAGERSEG